MTALTVQGTTYTIHSEREMINGRQRYFAMGPRQAMYVIFIDDEFTHVRSIMTGKNTYQFSGDTTIIK